MYKILALASSLLIINPASYSQSTVQHRQIRTPDTPAQPVTAILGAFGDEITLLLSHVENKKESTLEGIRFTEGTLQGRKVVVALTGIGKVNAAITTTLALEHFHPSEVLFSGVAGGVDTALSPGDLVIGTNVAYNDYGTLTPDSLELRPTRSPIDNQLNPLYFPCDSGLIALALRAGKDLALEKPGNRPGQSIPRIVSGTIVTGDVFVASHIATQSLRRRMNAEATEMEGAAVAQTCWQQRVPFLVIRSLSDDAGSKAYNDAVTFYQVAARNSARLVMEIVRKLDAAAH
jgi:adenosylhomocysteine nucleosidase